MFGICEENAPKEPEKRVPNRVQTKEVFATLTEAFPTILAFSDSENRRILTPAEKPVLAQTQADFATRKWLRLAELHTQVRWQGFLLSKPRSNERFVGF